SRRAGAGTGDGVHRPSPFRFGLFEHLENPSHGTFPRGPQTHPRRVGAYAPWLRRKTQGPDAPRSPGLLRYAVRRGGAKRRLGRIVGGGTWPSASASVEDSSSKTWRCSLRSQSAANSVESAPAASPKSICPVTPSPSSLARP